MNKFFINRKNGAGGSALQDSIKKNKTSAEDESSEIQYLRNQADDDSTPSNLTKSY